MKAIRKLNNNAAICETSDGKEVIAMGKGIGFGQMPREVSISEIDRTFYNIDLTNENIMRDLPTDVVLFSAQVMDIVINELPYELTDNAVLVLADHIAFAIERSKNNIKVKMPIAYDLQQMYPLEYKISEYILERIHSKFGIALPVEEVAGIAMNLINSKKSSGSGIEQSETESFSEMLAQITEIIENDFHIIVRRDSFDYARFATHMQYLFQRLNTHQSMDTANVAMYTHVKEEFPEVAKCVDKISAHIQQEWHMKLSEEEKLYVMLHVNRVTVREGL